MIKEYHVATLAEFYEAIQHIGMSSNDKRFWFRGQSYNYYKLLPSLYRDQTYDCNTHYTYSQMDLKEDYRYQHMKTRSFHSVQTNPVYKIEWQEIYQHHFGQTRLMDWSESAKTALSFALEAYLDPRNREDLEIKRKNSTPHVWVLNPYKLNEKVYEYFGKTFESYVSTKLDSAFEEIDSLNDLCQEIQKNKDIYFDTGKGDLEISGIISLCVLEECRRNLGSQFIKSVNDFEFNPFYYLALRMYSDGVPFPVQYGVKDILPPIAILHPYHSERIRTQRGAFTMFPNYILDHTSECLLNKRKIDVREMERQTYIEDCLSVIYIDDAHSVVKNLSLGGERRSELYPDIQTYADIIETQTYHY